MKKIFFCILIFFTYSIYAGDNDLLHEYTLLYTDLLNLRTWGYKSFYNGELNRADGYIHISQGAIEMTEVPFDCAIIGEGFFKIRLADDSEAYTRSGNFRVDQNGTITTSQGYPLYETICLGETFLPDSFTITKDHSMYVSTVDTNNTITRSQLGRLLTYKIPNEYLEHYEDAIYTIKETADYEEEITFDNYLIQGSLELSNYALLPVVIRMYYILSLLDENVIPHIEFKKELLKIQIENLSNTEEILPFIHYDY